MNDGDIKEAISNLDKGCFLRNYCEDYFDLKEIREGLYSKLGKRYGKHFLFDGVNKMIDEMPKNIEKMLAKKSVPLIPPELMLSRLIGIEDYLNGKFSF